MAKTITDEKRRWMAKVRSVRDDRRIQVITDAHDKGGLSHQEIADLLELSRIRIIQIISKERKERAKKAREEEEANG